MLDVSGLAELGAGQNINALGENELKLLQRGLNGDCYGAGPVDGDIGPRTRTAFADFVDDCGGGGDHNILTATASKTLSVHCAQWQVVLAMPSATRADVKAAIIAACKIARFGMHEQIAYVLATTEHETANQYRPVREGFYLHDGGEAHRRTLRYSPYFGRGYVQLTWKKNYAFYGSILGIDLENTPDLALEHDVSLFVLVHGMKTGAFTGKSLENYISPASIDRINARRVINSTDRASDIAEIAARLETELA